MEANIMNLQFQNERRWPRAGMDLDEGGWIKWEDERRRGGRMGRGKRSKALEDLAP